MLQNETYTVSPYRTEVIKEPKERLLLKLPYYPDRIVQWAIMLQLREMFDRLFSGFSCACVKGKGIHYAKKLVQKYLEGKDNRYCLKLDIKKFYDNIDHEVLMSLLGNKIKDEKLLRLLSVIICSIPGGKGLPLGSYLSQYFANLYLTELDNYLKHDLKIKHVVRYMDDIVILSDSREQLHDWFRQIEQFCDEKLELKIKENWQVFPIKERGIDFVGYRIFPNYVLLRKSICKRYKKKMVEIQKNGLTLKRKRTVASYNGWLSHCNSFRLKQKYHPTKFCF